MAYSYRRAERTLYSLDHSSRPGSLPGSGRPWALTYPTPSAVVVGSTFWPQNAPDISQFLSLENRANPLLSSFMLVSILVNRAAGSRLAGYGDLASPFCPLTIATLLLEYGSNEKHPYYSIIPGKLSHRSPVSPDYYFALPCGCQSRC